MTSFMLLSLLLLSVNTTKTAQHLLSQTQRYSYAMIVGIALSIIGFVGTYFFLLAKKCVSAQVFRMVLKILSAFACGSLIGDAFIHILGQAYVSQNINQNLISVILISSLIFFIILEKLFELCGVEHNHFEDDEHQHQPDLEHGNPHHQNFNNIDTLEVKPNDVTAEFECEISKKSSQPENTINLTDQNSKNSSQQGKLSLGYLNIFGSFLHNIMDGLMIGFSFATGDKAIYMPTVLAMFAHEIPREIGDAVILHENNFSDSKILISNAVINIISLIGVGIGLVASVLDTNTQKYVMVFVAGNFIFIASDLWRRLFKGDLKISLLQFISLSAGIGIMLIISLFESRTPEYYF